MIRGHSRSIDRKNCRRLRPDNYIHITLTNRNIIIESCIMFLFHLKIKTNVYHLFNVFFQF